MHQHLADNRMTIKRGQRPLFLFIICIFALMIVIAAYLPGLKGPFLLDDMQSIEPAQLTQLSWQQLLETSLQNDSGPVGRPISIASFALNSYFFGLNPYAFKAVNLGIHLLVGIALANFIYLLMTLYPGKRAFALSVAFFTTLIWLIHPLQVSTVLYPVQRMTQLGALFILFGLNTYLLGRIRLNAKRKFGLSLMALSYCIFFPLAILSKETGALFPWYVFCIEFFFLKFRTPKSSWSYYLKHFQYVLSLVILLAALIYYQQHLAAFLARFAEKNFTLFDRLYTESHVLIFYMKLILLPRLAEMSLYHDDFPLITHFDFSSIIILLLFLTIAFCRRKAPIIAFGLAWFFISHVIESTILPLELVFEHRNYLASIGLILIAVYYFLISVKHLRPTLRYTYCMAGTLVLIVFVGLTYTRSINWSSPERFLVSEAVYHPQSPRVHLEIANWLLANKQYSLAFDQLTQAQVLQPYNAGIALHKLLIFCHAQSVPDELYTQAAQKIRQGAITPYVIMVFNAMVSNMFHEECASLNNQKVLNLLQLASENPYLIYKPYYQAVLYHLQAGVALMEKHPEQCRELLYKSFEIYPNRLDPLIEKAYLELNAGLIKEAEGTLTILKQQAQTLGMKAPKQKLMRLEHAYQNKRGAPHED